MWPHWDWKTVLPMGMSGVALILSVLTYSMNTGRDEEARELALMGRQLEVWMIADSRAASWIAGRLSGSEG